MLKELKVPPLDPKLDVDPPFSLPDDSHSNAPAGPLTADPNLQDSQELYDEGIADTAEPINSNSNQLEEGFDREETG
jgi:hypothetical protein